MQKAVFLSSATELDLGITARRLEQYGAQKAAYAFINKLPLVFPPFLLVLLIVLFALRTVLLTLRTVLFLLRTARLALRTVLFLLRTALLGLRTMRLTLRTALLVLKTDKYGNAGVLRSFMTT